MKNGKQTHFPAKTIIQELLEGVPQTYQEVAIDLRGYIEGTHLQLWAEYEDEFYNAEYRANLRIDLGDPTSIDTAQNWLTNIFKRKYSSTHRNLPARFHMSQSIACHCCGRTQRLPKLGAGQVAVCARCRSSLTPQKDN